MLVGTSPKLDAFAVSMQCHLQWRDEEISLSAIDGQTDAQSSASLPEVAAKAGKPSVKQRSKERWQPVAWLDNLTDLMILHLTGVYGPYPILGF